MKNRGNFSISDALRDGYRTSWRMRAYLLRLSVIPLVVHALTQAVKVYVVYDAQTLVLPSPYLMFLLELPATVAFGWFIFAQSRAMLLGERTDSLPAEAGYRAARLDCLRASVIFFILYKMFMTVCYSLMLKISQVNPQAEATLPTVLFMVLVGIMFWSVRLTLAPAVSAVGYSVKHYIFAVNGAMISLNLLAVGFVCLLPVFMMMALVNGLILGGDVSAEPTQAQVLAVGAAMAPITLFFFATANAAAVCGLRQLFARSKA